MSLGCVSIHHAIHQVRVYFISTIDIMMHVYTIQSHSVPSAFNLCSDNKNYILKENKANTQKIHSFYPNIDHTPFISQVHHNTESQCSSGCIGAFACKAKMVTL